MVDREIKIHEGIVSVAGKEMKFASLNPSEKERFQGILDFITRTYDKILKDVSDEKFLEATKINRKMTAADHLRKDNSLKKDPATNFAMAWIEGMASLFGMDRYSLFEMRQTYESGYKIGYDQGVVDASRTRRNPLSHLEGEMSEDQNEFYNKFLDLCNEYNIRIEYNSDKGMGFYPLRYD